MPAPPGKRLEVGDRALEHAGEHGHAHLARIVVRREVEQAPDGGAGVPVAAGGPFGPLPEPPGPAAPRGEQAGEKVRGPPIQKRQIGAELGAEQAAAEPRHARVARAAAKPVEQLVHNAPPYARAAAAEPGVHHIYHAAPQQILFRHHAGVLDIKDKDEAVEERLRRGHRAAPRGAARLELSDQHQPGPCIGVIVLANQPLVAAARRPAPGGRAGARTYRSRPPPPCAGARAARI